MNNETEKPTLKKYMRTQEFEALKQAPKVHVCYLLMIPVLTCVGVFLSWQLVFSGVLHGVAWPKGESYGPCQVIKSSSSSRRSEVASGSIGDEDVGFSASATVYGDENEELDVETCNVDNSLINETLTHDYGEIKEEKNACDAYLQWNPRLDSDTSTSIEFMTVVLLGFLCWGQMKTVSQRPEFAALLWRKVMKYMGVACGCCGTCCGTDQDLLDMDLKVRFPRIGKWCTKLGFPQWCAQKAQNVIEDYVFYVRFKWGANLLVLPLTTLRAHKDCNEIFVMEIPNLYVWSMVCFAILVDAFVVSFFMSCKCMPSWGSWQFRLWMNVGTLVAVLVYSWAIVSDFSLILSFSFKALFDFSLALYLDIFQTLMALMATFEFLDFVVTQLQKSQLEAKATEMQTATDGTGAITIECTVPDDAKEGSTMRVRTPKGRVVEVKLPDQIVPGAAMQFEATAHGFGPKPVGAMTSPGNSPGRV